LSKKNNGFGGGIATGTNIKGIDSVGLLRKFINWIQYYEALSRNEVWGFFLQIFSDFFRFFQIFSDFFSI
jgi:hypothetical protein